MTSLVELYQEELKLLKDSAKIFSEEHPALTESLTRDSTDPDIEMILQGVSYITSQFRRDINDQFPVALQALSQALTPTLMQPIPAVSILSMEPKANLITPLKVKKGKGFDSSPIENNGSYSMPCRYSNVWDIEVLPLSITDISSQHKDRNIEDELRRVIDVKLNIDSSRNNLANYQFDKLRLFINQPINDASMWILMLAQQLISVEVKDEWGVHILPNTAVTQTGFNPRNNIFENESSASIHQLLQEYFIAPEKFQFIDLDLSSWQQRSGEKFEINFICNSTGVFLPELGQQDIKLFCSPIVNLFEHYAEPMVMNGVQLEFPLTAKQRNASSEQVLPIIDVVRVESVKRDREKNYRYQNLVKPDSSKKKSAGYHFYRKNGGLDGIIENWLALDFESGQKQEAQEVLRVKVKCSHGRLASQIPPGNIRHPTSSSPELVKFTNLTTSTDYQPGIITTNMAWEVVSDQALSLQSINSVEQLKDLLSHHIPSQFNGSAKYKTLQHRISGIEQVKIVPKDHFEQGKLQRGVLYDIRLDCSHFINSGESFLFTSLLDQLFSLQIPLNSFSQLIVTDSITGNKVTWPIRLGSVV
jgi:type VI secretion system protein ImpG